MRKSYIIQAGNQTFGPFESIEDVQAFIDLNPDLRPTPLNNITVKES